MDIVPVHQSKWHLLVPEILFNIVDNLDFYSCESLRKSCKNFRSIINSEYCRARIRQLGDVAQQMDVDSYTRNMVFLVRHNASMCAYFLFRDTNEENRHETKALWHLAGEFDEKLWPYYESDGVQFYNEKHLETMFKILAKDSEKNTRDYSTPGHYFGGLQIIRLILCSTMNVNFQNEEGNTLLHCAKRLNQCKYLLNQSGIDVNIQNKKGETPLCYAIKHPRYRCYNGSYDVMAGVYEWDQANTLIADKRTNLFLKTKKGKTIFHYAAQCGSNRKGHRDLRCTTKTTGFYILKLLVERLQQDDLFAVDNKGRTALYLAVKHGHIDAVELLFPKFSDHVKFSVDKDGKTLLHTATHKKYGDGDKVIMYLFTQFPKEMKYVRDREGKTFFDYVQDKEEIILWLLSKNDDNICTAAGSDTMKVKLLPQNVIEQNDSHKDKSVIPTAAGHETTKIKSLPQNYVVDQDKLYKDNWLQFFYKHKKALVVGSLASLMISVAAYFYMISE